MENISGKSLEPKQSIRDVLAEKDHEIILLRERVQRMGMENERIRTASFRVKEILQRGETCDISLKIMEIRQDGDGLRIIVC